MNAVLLVDDDRAFAAVAAAALQRESMAVETARSLYEARAALEKHAPDVIILDRRLPDGDGLQALPEFRQKAPNAAIVLVTAHGDVASAVEAIRLGASDYLVKPVELLDLVMKSRLSAESKRRAERLEQAEAELSGRHRMVAPTSERMRQLLNVVARVSRSPRSPVLILGETGVGKEVLARHLHRETFGENAPFVHVNCAALPETIFESELFGHERGAFTDARSARRGLVELAGGGTLFLDEVGELPLSLQSKLLTFLDGGRFRRLGGTTEQTSQARVVAATNRDLSQQAREGRFREDLLFRLDVFRLELPPLRHRREDIAALAEGLLRLLAAELGRRDATLGRMAMARLSSYHFPGNIRELRNLIERALVLESGPELQLDLLAAGPTPPAADTSRFVVSGDPMPLAELETRYVRHVLERLDGRRVEAAGVLGISYPTFLKKLGENG